MNIDNCENSPKQNTLPKRSIEAGVNRRVPLTLTLEHDMLVRLRNARKKMNVFKEQDVIRMAVTHFLEKHGY